jgi:hypothetical protein
VLPAARITATSAMIARMLSKGLKAATATGAGAVRGAAAAVGAGREGAAGAAAEDRGAAGAWAGAAAAVLSEGAGAAAADGPVGPPGGKVGNLIVGAAEGLGGKLMRTVSFFG